MSTDDVPTHVARLSFPARHSRPGPCGWGVGRHQFLFAFSVACRVLVRSLPEADNIWQKSWMCSRRVLVKMECDGYGYCVVVFRFVLVFCHLFYPAGGLALPISPSLKLPRAVQKLSRNWTHQIFLTPDHCIQFSPNFISTLSAPSQCSQHVRYLVPSSGGPSPPRPDRYAGLGISVAFATPSGFSMD